LKGITGRKLFEKYPAIRQKLWKGQLWNHSYYVETIGSVSDLFEKYPAIRQKLWKGQLWNHSYYVETIGSVSEENI
ncbi:transposase, partial [Clostridium sp. AM42-4]|uniref:transposase n=1 Tax=Clostridium sp. AM42-4 TaxID=2292305 RepID=UPI001FAA9F71